MPARSRAARLPDVEHLTVDRRKFVDYSMDPSADNGGKWRAWGALGYEVHRHRDAAADDVIRQIMAQRRDAEAIRGPRTRVGAEVSHAVPDHRLERSTRNARDHMAG